MANHSAAAKPCDSSVFQRVRARVPLKLLPSTLCDVAAAIHQELASMLLRLNTPLGGVPVAFSEVKIPEEDCEIFEDQPQLHLNVVCTFVLFAPKVGQSLSGVVNNIAEDSVGVLILETFNATIPYDELAPHLVYDSKKAVWKRKGAKGIKIGVGDTIYFKCTGIKAADTVVQVMGSPMLPDAAGRKPAPGEDSEGEIVVGLEQSSGKDKKEGKKRKSSVSKNAERQGDNPVGPSVEGDAGSGKKKKKKKKSLEADS